MKGNLAARILFRTAWVKGDWQHPFVPQIHSQRAFSKTKDQSPHANRRRALGFPCGAFVLTAHVPPEMRGGSSGLVVWGFGPLVLVEKWETSKPLVQTTKRRALP